MLKEILISRGDLPKEEEIDNNVFKRALDSFSNPDNEPLVLHFRMPAD